MRRSLALVAALLLACGSGKKSGAPEEGEQGATKPAAPSADEAEATTPAAAANPPGDDGPADDAEAAGAAAPELSAFDSAEVAAAAAGQARARNAEGLELHEGGEYGGAIEKYAAALRANPGHVLARYNLACALNLAGETERGLEVLAQLDRDDCRACRAQLVWARTDGDWKSARQHPRFVELTAGVSVASPTPKQAAKKLIAAFDRRSPEPIAELVHPDLGVRVVDVFGLCNPDVDDCGSVKQLYGLAALTKEIREQTRVPDYDDPDEELMTSYEPPRRISGCSKTCCHFEMEEVTHGMHHLGSVCFRDAAGVLWIAEFSIIDES